MSELVRPPSLRTFLDAGCDITTQPGWECLAEAVVLHGGRSRDAQLRFAHNSRAYAETWLAGGTTWLVAPSSPPAKWTRG